MHNGEWIIEDLKSDIELVKRKLARRTESDKRAADTVDRTEKRPADAVERTAKRPAIEDEKAPEPGREIPLHERKSAKTGKLLFSFPDGAPTSYYYNLHNDTPVRVDAHGSKFDYIHSAQHGRLHAEDTADVHI